MNPTHYYEGNHELTGLSTLLTRKGGRRELREKFLVYFIIEILSDFL
jgi:hypothetical protein